MFKVRVSQAVTAALLLAIPLAAQTNAAAPLSGCVQKAGNSYTLTDDASKTTFQLRGGNLKAGEHVQVAGTPASGAAAAKGAAQLFDVTNVTRTSGTCPGAHGGGRHLSKAHIISIAIVSGLVITGIVIGAGRIGPAF
ncbi:MAG TPA: hypothetical protein VNH18_08380 [Bryobacteraceae bacterium]|nr:hypothetical protein [Bryobacteraceae bacterium]